MSQALQAVFSGVALGAVFAVIGIGYVVIYRVTRLVNLAQGAFAVLGAMVMSTLVGHLPWALAALLASLAAAAGAALAGLLALTGNRHPEFAPIVVTLGLAIATEGVFVLVWGDLPVSYPPVSDRAIEVAGAFLLPQQLLLLGALLLALLALQQLLGRSYLGKALTAAALNRPAAQLAGINLLAVGTFAFAVSGFVAGLAGALLAALVPMTAASQLGLAVNGFAAAVLGNLFSPLGALAGGLMLGLLQGFAASYGLVSYQQVVALVAMIAFLLAQAAWQRRGGTLA